MSRPLPSLGLSNRETPTFFSSRRRRRRRGGRSARSSLLSTFSHARRPSLGRSLADSAFVSHHATPYQNKRASPLPTPFPHSSAVYSSGKSRGLKRPFLNFIRLPPCSCHMRFLTEEAFLGREKVASNGSEESEALADHFAHEERAALSVG